MRYALILLMGVFLIACNQTPSENNSSDNNHKNQVKERGDFDWLLGDWKRLNEDEGKETFENWEKVSNLEYRGIGFTMENGDTIKQEQILLIKTNGRWDLKVKAPEDDEYIVFRGSNYNSTEFTCVNSELTFPSKIKYWKNGDRINALVSGDWAALNFEFVKQ